MAFRKLVIAAVVLVVASVAALAAYQIAADARGEARQVTIEQNDSLAFEPDYRQKLVANDSHDPTAYGENITVVYNGTELDPGGNYTYYQEDGEIEFLRDEPGEADITYRYDVPADQVADSQLQTLTESYSQVMLVGVGLTFVVLFLFVGGFAARRMGIGTTTRRGR